METIQWLSNFFYKLRLSTLDFRSFGLFSKWSPYMDGMKTLLGYLVKRMLDSEMACLAQDPSANSKTGNKPLMPHGAGSSDIPSEVTWIHTLRDLDLCYRLIYLSVTQRKWKIYSIGANPYVCSFRQWDACFSLSLPLLCRAEYRDRFQSPLLLSYYLSC